MSTENKYVLGCIYWWLILYHEVWYKRAHYPDLATNLALINMNRADFVESSGIYGTLIIKRWVWSITCVWYRKSRDTCSIHNSIANYYCCIPLDPSCVRTSVQNSYIHGSIIHATQPERCWMRGSTRAHRLAYSTPAMQYILILPPSSSYVFIR